MASLSLKAHGLMSQPPILVNLVGVRWVAGVRALPKAMYFFLYFCFETESRYVA